MAVHAASLFEAFCGHALGFIMTRPASEIGLCSIWTFAYQERHDVHVTGQTIHVCYRC
jgi:hypothetical protein